jgi:hypothetical protein
MRKRDTESKSKTARERDTERESKNGKIESVEYLFFHLPLIFCRFQQDKKTRDKGDKTRQDNERHHKTNTRHDTKTRQDKKTTQDDAREDKTNTLQIRLQQNMRQDKTPWKTRQHTNHDQP